MKTFKRDVEPSLELESLYIETADLIQILGDIFPEPQDFSIEIGNLYDSERYEIESLEEAKVHRSIIKNPLKFKSGELVLSVDRWDAAIGYSTDNSAIAASLYERLLEHGHPLKWITKPWSPAIVIVAFSVATGTIFDELFGSPLGYGILAMMSAAVVIPYSIKVQKPQVYYRTRVGFWQKNRDAILIGIFFTVFGWFLGQLSPDFLSVLGEQASKTPSVIE